MRFLKSFSELIFPATCILCNSLGKDICDTCLKQKFKSIHPSCYKCNRLTKNYKTCKSCTNTTKLNNVYACYRYEKAEKKVINHLKFHNSAYLAEFVAQELHKRLPHFDAVVTNVPTAPSRVRIRGYDQSKIIANELCRIRNLQYQPVLLRVNNDKQVGSSALKRKSQAKHFFDCKTIIPEKVLIIDDVMTTGATLESAAKLLKQNGAKIVYAGVFARV